MVRRIQLEFLHSFESCDTSRELPHIQILELKHQSTEFSIKKYYHAAKAKPLCHSLFHNFEKSSNNILWVAAVPKIQN